MSAALAWARSVSAVSDEVVAVHRPEAPAEGLVVHSTKVPQGAAKLLAQIDEWSRSPSAASTAPQCLTEAPPLPEQPPVVVIVERGGDLVVTAPYVPIFAERMIKVPGVRAEQQSPSTRTYHVPVAHRRGLWNRICASFPQGTVVVGKRGRAVL